MRYIFVFIFGGMVGCFLTIQYNRAVWSGAATFNDTTNNLHTRAHNATKALTQ